VIGFGGEWDARWFTAHGRHGMVERRPICCPQGHPFGPDLLLVAAHPCTCVTRPHRIWRCWACDQVWVRPPCRLHPDWVGWPTS